MIKIKFPESRSTNRTTWESGTIISAYDLSGKRVFRQIQDNTTNTLNINTSSWLNGIYLISILTEGKNINEKVVIEK